MEKEKLWPSWLLYWRRMGSRDISDYLERTPPEKRLILIVWGVLEAHGPWLSVAADSMMAEVAANKLAYRLYHEKGIQPIIFDSFKDIGSYSATRGFPGAVAIEGWLEYQPGKEKKSPILQIWRETLSRLQKEGFNKFFLVNGDGGNWMNYVHRDWDAGFHSALEKLAKELNVQFDGANWDQEGGEPWKHGGHHEHAWFNWLLTGKAPEFDRSAALRAGIEAVSEDNLRTIDGTSFEHLEDSERRRSNWAEIPEQKKLRGITHFSFAEYGRLKNGEIEKDVEDKIDQLMKRIDKV